MYAWLKDKKVHLWIGVFKKLTIASRTLLWKNCLVNWQPPMIIIGGLCEKIASNFLWQKMQLTLGTATNAKRWTTSSLSPLSSHTPSKLNLNFGRCWGVLLRLTKGLLGVDIDSIGPLPVGNKCTSLQLLTFCERTGESCLLLVNTVCRSPLW